MTTEVTPGLSRAAARLAPGQRGFALYSAGTAITMPATMALAAAGFGQSPRLAGLGGLFQRASIITGFAWLTAVSARALPHAPATGIATPTASTAPLLPGASTQT
ncbi:MAG: hypothetical protein ACM32E_07185 [Gemmatimonadota bacterium]